LNFTSVKPSKSTGSRRFSPIASNENPLARLNACMLAGARREDEAGDD
jgi:hypothetical protein